MAQFFARAHRRYAHNLPIELQPADMLADAAKAAGLLIEISQEYARVSQLECDAYEPGDIVTVTTPCGKSRKARVRWTREAIAGLRFEEALRLQELTDWLACRKLAAEEPELQYAS
ncbi:PilZ domain-containing protein [Aurantiacibacter sp. MUD61]|uniref:PilZ domain-containing protein n=1 Tax=Aurantiacibacter sp. MUD61 TaxID=3009083 RepID=UPI0022F08346|nr:PilZ domain-containing protein [Aurantiacibacter sp. MUD61]